MLTNYEIVGLEMFVLNAVKILNHASALDYYENALDALFEKFPLLATLSLADSPMNLGAMLVQRFQLHRSHSWIPQPSNVNEKSAKKVHFAKVSQSANFDVQKIVDHRMVDTLIPNKPAREYVNLLFSNITTWGAISQNWLFSAEVLNKFQLYGLVETHAGRLSDPDLCARAAAHGHSVVSNPAMDYPDTGGNHGGEAIFVAKHLHAIPVDVDIISLAAHVNDEPGRWTSTEIRISQVSILVITAYLWCGEGLSSRNWAILEQI